MNVFLFALNLITALLAGVGGILSVSVYILRSKRYKNDERSQEVAFQAGNKTLIWLRFLLIIPNFLYNIILMISKIFHANFTAAETWKVWVPINTTLLLVLALSFILEFFLFRHLDKRM